MADLNDFKAWVARDLNYKGTSIRDHVEGAGSKSDFTMDTGVEHEEITIRIYTQSNRYTIRAAEHIKGGNQLGGYLGCQSLSRTPRAGAEAHGGRDLPDGLLTEETWRKILNAIVSFEMVKVHESALGSVARTWERPEPYKVWEDPLVPQVADVPGPGDGLRPRTPKPGEILFLNPGQKASDVIPAIVTARIPKIGDIVIYCSPTKDQMGDDIPPCNGHRNHPAVVTNVWSPGCVNLKVFFDCADCADETSVNIRSTPDGTDNPHCYWEWPE